MGQPQKPSPPKTTIFIFPLFHSGVVTVNCKLCMLRLTDQSMKLNTISYHKYHLTQGIDVLVDSKIMGRSQPLGKPTSLCVSPTRDNGTVNRCVDHGIRIRDNHATLVISPRQATGDNSRNHEVPLVPEPLRQSKTLKPVKPASTNLVTQVRLTR
ncbi:hypothetical protein FEAC_10150 [Ferrimicrobium acidiphilum DSM 19497]|uniref:Uncharacterized protein n=1 Tax=Ferrimicrobium acidiphilum DSM 19497 TaxID=1121877 RepID=A0A0D8FW36_9ACTN|nr:hypothetical protein FEAC_10150 [Ferrimicrobium acidiphilum DSM 19497]